jgi:hypothetical protein
MQRVVFAMLGVVLWGTTVQAEDKDLQALVDKAIQATGGVKALTRYKGHSAEDRGTYHGMGFPIPYTSSSYYLAPDKVRVEIDAKAGDDAIKFVRVINGVKGWMRINAMTQELGKEEMAEEREQMHAGRLTQLVPLKNKGMKLSSLGESKVGDRDAIGIRVETRGYRPVNLHFDKKTHLLLKTEQQVKNIQAGSEHNQVTLFSDYKKVMGIQTPHKITMTRDGKPYVESIVTKITYAETLDDDLFQKP